MRANIEGRLHLHDELGHGVWNLLEEDWTETRVESTDTLVLHDLAHTTNKTVGETRLGDETDTGGLERAEGDVGKELSSGRRGEVDGGAVVGGSLVTEGADTLALEKLVSTELEGALKEVTSKGWADTSPDGTSTLLSDDLAESGDHTLVVLQRVELDSGLDARPMSVSCCHHCVFRS